MLFTLSSETQHNQYYVGFGDCPQDAIPISNGYFAIHMNDLIGEVPPLLTAQQIADFLDSLNEKHRYTFGVEYRP